MNAIVDAHHHIWRQRDLPWLMGPMLPRIFGPYEPIRRDYPIEEYLADATPHGIAASVYVQANWAAERGLDEAHWIDAESRRTGWPTAQIAYADFSSDTIEEHLSALTQIATVRGVRQQLHWHTNELYRFAPRPGLMNDAKWRRGFAHLQDHGFLFELQVFASQMQDGARLAVDFPDIPMVLMHCGMPEDLSEDEMISWRKGMRLLADRPNMNVKLSGLGTFIRSNNPAHVARIAGETIDIFGPERCVFGSNFPIEKLWCTYDELIAAHRAALRNFDETLQHAILAGNARRIYRLQ